jgi:hypothetical protein
LSLATIRAAMIPGSVASSSSARLIGRTLPAIGDGICCACSALAGAGADNGS